VHPLLLRFFDGQIAPFDLGIDDLVEYVSSVLGALIVLAVGSIWRKRRLQRGAATAADAASVRRPAVNRVC